MTQNATQAKKSRSFTVGVSFRLSSYYSLLWVLNIIILAIHSQLNTATYYYLTKHFLGNRMILKEYFYYYSVAERSESLRV